VLSCHGIVFGGNSDNLLTAENYNASASTAPVTAVNAAAAADDDDDNAKMTSLVDDASQPTTAQRKTRKKRRSSGGKPAGTGDDVTTEQHGKGFLYLFTCSKDCSAEILLSRVTWRVTECTVFRIHSILKDLQACNKSSNGQVQVQVQVHYPQVQVQVQVQYGKTYLQAFL